MRNQGDILSGSTASLSHTAAGDVQILPPDPPNDTPYFHGTNGSHHILFVAVDIVATETYRRIIPSVASEEPGPTHHSVIDDDALLVSPPTQTRIEIGSANDW